MQADIIGKFQNQRLAAQIIEYNANRENDPQKRSRQAHCLQSLNKHSATVELWKEPGSKIAYYSGLQTCGSPWACPICAQKISEFRREELKVLIDKALDCGKYIYMFTYTLPHYQHESCADVLGKFRDSKKKMKAQQIMKKSPHFKPWRKLLKYYQYDGSVTTMEVTYGKNGWHVHSHEIFIFDQPLIDQSQANDDFFQAWLKACDLTFGIGDYPPHLFKAFIKRSFKMEYLDGDSNKIISKYMTKSGMQIKEKQADEWGFAEEMAKGHLKKSEFGSLTPFGLLHAIRYTDNQDYAHDWKKKFFEYTQAFKGISFVRFSPGLRDQFGMQFLSDEEVAEGEKELMAKWYGFFERYQWIHQIRKYGLRGFVIQNSDLEWNDMITKLNQKIDEIEGKENERRYEKRQELYV